ncbi:MAG: hypothetical protein ABI740_02415 [Alphaproteobacteria bacterium]
MLKWVCAAGLVAALALPAMAQAPKKEDRSPKQLTAADAAVVKEAVDSIKQPGECTVLYTIGKDGKPKDMKADCTPADYAPFALKAMATVTWSPEMVSGEIFETEGMKQPFKFGVTVTAAAAQKPPVATVQLDGAEINRALIKTNAEGSCSMSYTVGVDGIAKDIVPNCTPDKFNKYIKAAIEKMRFTPGEKDGKPVDWPLSGLMLNLKKK